MFFVCLCIVAVAILKASPADGGCVCTEIKMMFVPELTT